MNDSIVVLNAGSSSLKFSVYSLADQDLTVYVIGVASGQTDPNIKPGQIEFEAYQGTDQSTPVAVQVADEGKPVTIAGLQFTFVRERQFTGLIVAKDPGAPVVWAGAGLLVLGVIMVFLFPMRRLWARVRPVGTGSDVRLAAASHHDLGFESMFQSVLAAVQEKGR